MRVQMSATTKNTTALKLKHNKILCLIWDNCLTHTHTPCVVARLSLTAFGFYACASNWVTENVNRSMHSVVESIQAQKNMQFHVLFPALTSASFGARYNIFILRDQVTFKWTFQIQRNTISTDFFSVVVVVVVHATCISCALFFCFVHIAHTHDRKCLRVRRIYAKMTHDATFSVNALSTKLYISRIVSCISFYRIDLIWSQRHEFKQFSKLNAFEGIRFSCINWQK